MYFLSLAWIINVGKPKQEALIDFLNTEGSMYVIASGTSKLLIERNSETSFDFLYSAFAILWKAA